MRLDNFDLNLLVAFDVLMQEKNVTRASKRLNITQSAMSATLKRLREALGDEILAQHGKKMFPTPYALEMYPEIANTISNLRKIIARKGNFNPNSSSRQFKIIASDYITSVLLVPLLNSFSDAAYAINFEIHLPDADNMTPLVNGEVDLILAPQYFLHPKHPSELVFEENYVVVGCADNPDFSESLTNEIFWGLGHVAVSISGKLTFLERWMNDAALNRRIETLVPSFQQAAYFVSGTKRICIMHERLARLMARSLRLKIAPLPFAMPPMREMLQYHSTRENDPGLIWLRKQMHRIAAETSYTAP